MTRIDTILIANRGEIARRIARTCRDMGIAVAAVYSDADEAAPFVREADVAVRIGPPPAAESYLRIDRIVDAARRVGADAVHPGYGFLAENAALARACAGAGIAVIGPRPEVIERLGSKREARRVAVAAGVPIVPGDDGDDGDDAALAQRARAVGLPVLLKPSAGGGGKGMRVVTRAVDLADAIAAARREARGAFGDDTLIVERYVDRPRHVEVQILGDEHGNVVHLGERECSIQRRHQKIVEEAPSPAVSPALRARMGDAALALARAVGYTNAGTVEFLLAPDGSFYFLEVNTRLQVEHPVTECVTGIDLVREQIRIARGEPLGFDQADVAIAGAAIECRLYAEDPDAGFLPASGRIVHWRAPAGAGVRVDSGVDDTSRAGPADVSIHYDPMLAKVIAHAETRREAAARLAMALRRFEVCGIPTNRELLLRVVDHPAFVDGALHTHFVDEHAADLAEPAAADEDRWSAAVAACLADVERRRAARHLLPALEPGFRNNPGDPQRVVYDARGGAVTVAYRNLGRRRFAVGRDAADGAVRVAAFAEDPVAAGAAAPLSIAIEDAGGVRRTWRVIADGARRYVLGGGRAIELVERPRFPDAAEAVPDGALVAPMPGAIVEVRVREGDRVAAGDTLVVLEAMKMEHRVVAAEAGVVARVLVAEGEQVDADTLLVVVEPAD
ncbi:MAG: biotin/lipoyl-binding protein [Deltaproteobacteria bacterium]|nr:MAG: biotin/lipoyl-binding protein [Deltaproteobacteria bacterium]